MWCEYFNATGTPTALGSDAWEAGLLLRRNRSRWKREADDGRRENVSRRAAVELDGSEVGADGARHQQPGRAAAEDGRAAATLLPPPPFGSHRTSTGVRLRPSVPAVLISNDSTTAARPAASGGPIASEYSSVIHATASRRRCII